MKKFAMLLILVLFVLSVGVIFAQDDEAANSSTEVIFVPNVAVICPGHNVMRTIRLAADLLLEFGSVNGEWEVPSVLSLTETEEGTTIVVGNFVLNCDSSAADISKIDRSEAFGLNQAPPEPENPLGLAESQDGHLIVYQGPANVRSCANPECSRIAIVRGGDTLVALGRNASSTWWYVQVGELRGWIWNDLVRIRGNLTGIPIIVTEGEPEAPHVYLSYPGNPIYDELSVDGKIICPIQAGLNYPLIGRTSDDSWLWIEALCLDGTTVQGWVNAEYVAIRNLGNVFVPVVGIKGP